MQEDLANLIDGVIDHAWRLKQRLEQGRPLDLATEQAVLRGLLLVETEAAISADFRGGDDLPREEPGPEEEGRLGGRGFLGIRYALVCWLDELFIVQSPWAARWNERKLEVELYGTNDRAWMFWKQARLAELRPRGDALEAFFLCVALGFRGELRDDPAKLADWVAAASRRLAVVPELQWSHPRDLDLPTRVPPLRGGDRLQRLVFAGAAAVLLLIPILTFLVVGQLGR
jgi:type VI secretion system protein ImpK